MQQVLSSVRTGVCSPAISVCGRNSDGERHFERPPAFHFVESGQPSQDGPFDT